MHDCPVGERMVDEDGIDWLGEIGWWMLEFDTDMCVTVLNLN